MASFLSRAALQFISKNATRAAHSGSATAGGHGGGLVLWRRLSFLVGIPAIALGMVNAYLGHLEHEDRPEFKPYSHMRIRTKRFPWGEGNKTLFHNPHVNALPDGYEDEH